MTERKLLPTSLTSLQFTSLPQLTELAEHMMNVAARGQMLIDEADKLGELIDTLAASLGYTVENVFIPLHGTCGEVPSRRGE
jgi:hypothetical protein